jgi:hypothetical protein
VLLPKPEILLLKTRELRAQPGFGQHGGCGNLALQDEPTNGGSDSKAKDETDGGNEHFHASPS